MIRSSFNDSWLFRPKGNAFSELLGRADAAWNEVRLPHDAMVAQERDGSDPAAGQRGYYPAGGYQYRKSFFVPEEYRHRRVTFEFEGVYRNARVFLNGDLAGQHAYGYSTFYVRADRFLKYGSDNEILVEAHSADDTRWYSGGGLYRNTWIMVGDLVHITPNGVRITTPAIDSDLALVEVATQVHNESPATRAVEVTTEIVGPDGVVVARDVAPLTLFTADPVTVRQRLPVSRPRLWSVEHPHLYTCRTSVTADGRLLDRETTRFGIRSLTVDPHRGLRLNGTAVKLRGACIHHDNGVIGAATIERAEQRRAEILKQAGFNAVRSAHNPISKAFLDACDQLGMLVIDELFDAWTRAKSAQDYALDFPVWWEPDVQAMVDKDFNHPSVILYSIGNEIPETGTAAGAAISRRLAEKIRSLDSTRFVTNGINGLLAAGPELLASLAGGSREKTDESADVNTLMNRFREFMPVLMASEMVGSKTAESISCLDVAGYNYLESRYELDRTLFPNRVIVGTETYPSEIDRNWRLVQDNSHVVGDFTWTGWDYLGEPGIGRVEYHGEDEEGHGAATGGTMAHAGYPWLTAWCGDIDITGHRRPASYYREIVFGLRSEPYIAVHRPERHDQQVRMAMWWSWSDSVSSWSWNGHEARPVRVEVYSAADEVGLLVNGRLIGTAPAGEKNRYKAEFDTVYEPGDIVAVAYTGGRETGRTVLRSATGEVLLTATADRTLIATDGTDLAYVAVTLLDEAGNLYNTADRRVTVEVTGPGRLQGFGNADPKTQENFFDTTRTTFDGRALAVIRPSAAGAITVTVTADGCQSSVVRIEARATPAPLPE